jgi:hypothetical protein
MAERYIMICREPAESGVECCLLEGHKGPHLAILTWPGGANDEDPDAFKATLERMLAAVQLITAGADVEGERLSEWGR